jgi:hypothetical protein
LPFCPLMSTRIFRDIPGFLIIKRSDISVPILS